MVVARVENGLRLTAVDDIAAGLGLAPGMSLADARAMVPRLAVAEADPQADRRLLERIADWCDRYTPLVALDPPDGLLLDITGCTHLFGGEAVLCADIEERIGRGGLAVRAAIAGTCRAAAALARHGGRKIVAPGGEKAALAPLPVAALRPGDAIVRDLDRLGLKTVGQIAAAPRAPLARRFGRRLLAALDQALGNAVMPLVPRRPPPPLVVERRLAEPVVREDDIRELVAMMAKGLVGDLRARGRGARQLRLTLFGVDGRLVTTRIGTSRPLAVTAAIVELFDTRLSRLSRLHEADDAGFGYDLLRLGVERSEEIAPVQQELASPVVAGKGMAGEGADVEQRIASLIDRLGARFGAARLRFVTACDSHWPERAERFLPMVEREGFGGIGKEADGASSWAGYGGLPRPLRLFARPEPIAVIAEVPDGPPRGFRWRNVFHDIARSEGPERIAAEWWHAPTALPTRDYYRVEDAGGRRFWVFRNGLYGCESRAPDWYLHGLFA